MVTITSGAPEGADLLVVPVMSGRVTACDPSIAPDLEELGTLLDAKDFTGKKSQTLFVLTPDGPTPEVLLIGLGDDVGAETLRRAAGSAARSSSRYATVATALNQVDIDGASSACVLGALLGAYEFDDYKSEPKPALFENLVLVTDEDVTEEIKEAWTIAHGVILARDLIDLMDALDSMLEGTEITTKEAKAFGCSIKRV